MWREEVDERSDKESHRSAELSIARAKPVRLDCQRPTRLLGEEVQFSPE